MDGIYVIGMAYFGRKYYVAQSGQPDFYAKTRDCAERFTKDAALDLKGQLNADGRFTHYVIKVPA